MPTDGSSFNGQVTLRISLAPDSRSTGAGRPDPGQLLSATGLAALCPAGDGIQSVLSISARGQLRVKQSDKLRARDRSALPLE